MDIDEVNITSMNVGDCEIDIVVPKAKLAIQVSYNLKNEDTLTHELSPLQKFQTALVQNPS